MPIEISWFDEEKTILFGRFTGDWTWGEYVTGFFDTIELAKGIEYRLDQIIDMSKSGSIPAGQALPHIRRSREYSKSLDIHLTVIVMANPIFRAILSTTATSNGQSVQRIFVDSIEDAQQLIKAD